MKGNMKTNEQLRRGSGNGRSNAMLSANNDITESAAKKTRILIVEDEPAMVEGLRDNFEYEGYDVVSAGDGVAGLQRALAGEPDLVGLGGMIPRPSGLCVCQQLKTKRPPLPLLILTARRPESGK